MPMPFARLVSRIADRLVLTQFKRNTEGSFFQIAWRANFPLTIFRCKTRSLVQSALARRAWRGPVWKAQIYLTVGWFFAVFRPIGKVKGLAPRLHFLPWENGRVH